ncbi:MAG: 5'-deoxynucleotidase [Oscillospiraceae bacterium]|jgi:5'-deoxynucleotidase|nr:5'-deoxynucleotidase [Oscillospiraceae bacterium]
MKPSSPFYALLLRMRHITRWPLMRSAEPENLSSHSLETAVLAHALATIDNERFGAAVDTDRVSTLALFHDASEVLTGDLPTPVKYHSPALRQAYATVEDAAIGRLLSLLPPDLLPAYTPLLQIQECDKPLWKYVKAADKLSALLKCKAELRAGNDEFRTAHQTILIALHNMDMPALEAFLAEFLPAFDEPIDGLLFT